MPSIITAKVFTNIKAHAEKGGDKVDKVYEKQILICAGTGCIASGTLDVNETLEKELAKHNLQDKVRIILSGCHGFCEKGPIFIVYPEDVFYCGITAEDIPEVVEEHLVKGNTVERLLYEDPASGDSITSHLEIPFYKHQKRVVLRNCGVIDPENIDEYIIRGGYLGLRKALNMEAREVIDSIKKSGLRGLGGAGFPVGRKWETAYKVESDKKYVVCNADEGDPGAFMDRSVLEGDPHSVLEGLMIAGKAIGGDEAYVYVRAEYPLAVRRLRKAIAQAEEYGLIGDNILNSGFNFKIKVKEGAGAFVCGESTALVMSIEGKRGMPKPLPRPRTTEAGLWDKPTVLNNVKTLSVVPQIINKGEDWFSSIGTESCKGTAVFALTGKIMSSGLIEVPMGIELGKIIHEIGGGIPGGKKFKAVQTGGPSGGCLPEEKLDLPVDFDTLLEVNSMMGSGGMVVLDETTCMVDVARYFLDFTFEESCGQCVPCRLGTQQMLQILNDICEGKGREGDIELLLELGDYIIKGSICGLGKTAPNPVLSTIRYFREEYELHIKEKHCTARSCKELISYRIDQEKCSGCGRCRKECPADAISGDKKVPHVIDTEKCTKCGLCFEKCPDKFRAVEVVTGKENMPVHS